jgi:hypothetical protein
VDDFRFRSNCASRPHLILAPRRRSALKCPRRPEGAR